MSDIDKHIEDMELPETVREAEAFIHELDRRAARLNELEQKIAAKAENDLRAANAATYAKFNAMSDAEFDLATKTFRSDGVHRHKPQPSVDEGSELARAQQVLSERIPRERRELAHQRQAAEQIVKAGRKMGSRDHPELRTMTDAEFDDWQHRHGL